MRGEGIEIKKRYNWTKQPNGRYTIFDVEIFSLFKDKERGEVGEAEAKEILENFAKDRESGYYPRIHVEHQEDDSSNKPGAGYIDNLRFDGNVFWADLAELTEPAINQIRQINLPYRSVEYNAEKKKIIGLALLESQPSFFVFPLLALASEPQQVTQQQQYSMSLRGKVIRFAMEDKANQYCFSCSKFCGCDKTSDKIKFCEDYKKKGEVMEEKKKFADEAPPVPDPDAAAPAAAPESPAGGDMPPWASKLMDGMNKIATVLEKLVQTDEEVHSEPDGDEDAEGNEPPGPEESDMAKPNSVAMQLKDLRRQIYQLQSRQSSTDYDAELRSVCEDNQNISYDRARATMMKFQDPAAKRVYIDDLRAGAVNFQEHEATRFAQNFKAAERGNVMQKFADKPMLVQKIAREAFQMWSDTARHPNQDVAKKFVKLHPDQQKFVEHCVEMEEVTPGYFKKLAL